MNKKQINMPLIFYVFMGTCVGAFFGLLAYVKDWI